MNNKYNYLSSYNRNKYFNLVRKLENIPRYYFTALPTPLQYLPRLTKELDGPRIFIKRDDLTGMATGGNKTRKLEFIIADAVNNNVTDIITQGATQTNHGSQTSTIASKYGLKCHLLLENRRMNKDKEYLTSGNILLSEILNTKLYHFDAGTDMNNEMKKLANKICSKDVKPYIIPGGASNARGSLGYVNCALEILNQANEKNLKITSIITATGSSGTHAGLATAFKMIESKIKVLGIGTNAKEEKQKNKILKLSKSIIKFLEIDSDFNMDDILVNCDYIGTGYGNTTEKCIEAIKLVARLEGIFLDPIYTGIAMGGLIDLIRKGKYKKGENIVFMHTGGQSALWAYKKYFKKDA